MTDNPQKATHSTMWEDGEVAGFRCIQNPKVEQVISIHADDDPAICEVCKAKLKLIWDVRIEEIAND